MVYWHCCSGLLLRSEAMSFRFEESNRLKSCRFTGMSLRTKSRVIYQFEQEYSDELMGAE